MKIEDKIVEWEAVLNETKDDPSPKAYYAFLGVQVEVKDCLRSLDKMSGWVEVTMPSYDAIMKEYNLVRALLDIKRTV